MISFKPLKDFLLIFFFQPNPASIAGNKNAKHIFSVFHGSTRLLPPKSVTRMDYFLKVVPDIPKYRQMNLLSLLVVEIY